MPGCGGLRRMRVADPRRGKGKRGGVRVIYLHVDEADIIFLMDIYGKDEQEDLTADQKKILKGLAQSLQGAAVHGGEGSQAGDVMKSPKSRKPLFERLKTALEEGIRPREGRDHPEDHDPRTARPAAGGRRRGTDEAPTQERDVPGRLRPTAQRVDQDRPELGTGPSQAVAGGLEADPGVSSQPVGPARGRWYVCSTRNAERWEADSGRASDEPILIPSLWPQEGDE